MSRFVLKVFSIFQVALTFSFEFETYSSGFGISSNSSNPEDWASFYAKYCGRECSKENGEFVTVTRHDLCSNPTCFPCDCGENCSMFGTCCLTFNTDTESYSYDIETSFDKNPLQWSEIIRCQNPAFSLDSYLMVAKCPSSWKDQETKEKCENPASDSFESITPFSDRETVMVFRNAHCAMCNDLPTAPNSSLASDYDPALVYPWPVVIRCRHYQNLFNLIDLFSFYLEALKLRECYVDFAPPVNESWSPTTCHGDFDPFSNDTQCSSPDETINHLCNTLPPHLSLTVDGHRNIFCALCTGLNTTRKCHRDRLNKIDDELYLSPIKLQFNSSSENSQHNHVSHFSYAIPDLSVHKKDIDCKLGTRKEKKSCLDGMCTLGKMLDRVTLGCKTAVPDIHGLGYNLTFGLFPQADLDNNTLDGLTRMLHQKLSNRTKAFGLSLTQFVQGCWDPGLEMYNSRNRSYFMVSGFVLANENTPRDEFEHWIVNSFLFGSSDLSQTFAVRHENAKWKVACLGDKMCDLYRRFGGNDTLETGDPFLHAGNDVCRETFVGYEHPLSFSQKERLMVDTLMEERQNFIDLNPSLSCPVAVFNISRPPFFYENGSLKVSLIIRDQAASVIVSDATKVSFKGNQLLMCVYLFMETTETEMMNPSWSEKVFLWFCVGIRRICPLVSIACLTMSFVTYCLFPVLRCLPGRNNMCLCLSLILAQTTIFLDVERLITFKSESLCLSFAIFYHYVWLTSLCWMNVCCIHMFRVFTGTRDPGEWSVAKTHRHYCLYAFGVPALLILLTIVSAATMSAGDSIGYHDKLCFLDFILTLIIPTLTFLVPYCLVMLTNFILFVCTIKTIRQVSNRAATGSSSGPGVLVYLKLYIITGLLWLLVIIEFMFVAPASYLILGPLHALQGVSFFVSFTCTSRVRQLYADMFCRKSYDTDSSVVAERNPKNLESSNRTKLT